MWVAFGDIGQVTDFPAIGLIEHVIEGSHYEKATDHFVLRHIRRLPLRMEYGAFLDKLNVLMNISEARGDIVGVIDGCGVGRAVKEMADKKGMDITPICATGTPGEGFNSYGWPTVHKLELVQGLIVSMENDRFHIAADLPPGLSYEQEREFNETMTLLRKEMMDLKPKPNDRTRKVGIEAGHESTHDDMIMGICIGLYWLKKNTACVEEMDFDEKPSKPYEPLNHGM